MSYLIKNYKGKYRLQCEYNQVTNDFNRKLNGTYEDVDVYIDCLNNIKIFYYGSRGMLSAYIPSLGRGHNIIKSIYSDFIKDIESSSYITVSERQDKDGNMIQIKSYDYAALYKDEELNKIITNIEDTDEEVLFRFHSSKMEQLEKYFKPKTNAASRSPFSTKNLPKSDYIIPDEDLDTYKNIVSKIPKEDVLIITHTTNNYIKSLVTKKNTWEDIKADMRLKGLKGKEYIHCIGHWNKYIKYLEKELCQT